MFHTLYCFLPHLHAPASRLTFHYQNPRLKTTYRYRNWLKLSHTTTRRWYKQLFQYVDRCLTTKKDPFLTQMLWIKTVVTILLEPFICRQFKTDIWLKFWAKEGLACNIFSNNFSFWLISPNYKFGSDLVKIRLIVRTIIERASAENCTF